MSDRQDKIGRRNVLKRSATAVASLGVLGSFGTASARSSGSSSSFDKVVEISAIDGGGTYEVTVGQSDANCEDMMDESSIEEYQRGYDEGSCFSAWDNFREGTRFLGEVTSGDTDRYYTDEEVWYIGGKGKFRVDIYGDFDERSFAAATQGTGQYYIATNADRVSPHPNADDDTVFGSSIYGRMDESDDGDAFEVVNGAVTAASVRNDGTTYCNLAFH